MKGPLLVQPPLSHLRKVGKIWVSSSEVSPCKIFSAHILTCEVFILALLLVSIFLNFLLVGFHNEPSSSRARDVGVDQGVSSDL
jgi:hypothetical protein